MRKKFFTVTERHIKLLMSANVVWSNVEFGAPCIDPKKPYGNFDVMSDIAKILGLELFEDGQGERYLTRQQLSLCKKLHAETEEALEILLSNCKIEEGTYECEEFSANWRKI